MSRAMPQSDDERLAADHRSALGAKWIYLVGLPVLLVAGIIVRSPNFRMEQGPDAHPFGGDFIHEWAGAYALMHGDPGTFYDWKTFSQLQHDPLIVGQSWNHHRFFPTIYPPFYYALATPLLLFPLPVAAILATYASLAMFVISLLWFRRTEHRATNILSWALPLSLLFTPLIENFASRSREYAPSPSHNHRSSRSR